MRVDLLHRAFAVHSNVYGLYMYFLANKIVVIVVVPWAAFVFC